MFKILKTLMVIFEFLGYLSRGGGGSARTRESSPSRFSDSQGQSLMTWPFFLMKLSLKFSLQTFSLLNPTRTGNINLK